MLGRSIEATAVRPDTLGEPNGRFQSGHLMQAYRKSIGAQHYYLPKPTVIIQNVRILAR